METMELPQNVVDEVGLLGHTMAAKAMTAAGTTTTTLLWGRVLDMTGKTIEGGKPDPLIFLESRRGAMYAIYGGEFRSITDGFKIAPEFEKLYQSDLAGRRRALVELAVNPGQRSAFCVVGLYAPDERVLAVWEGRCGVGFDVAMRMRIDADARGAEAIL